MSVKIEGAEHLLHTINNIADLTTVKANMGKACALVEGEARRKAPKTAQSTGTLKRSIESKVEVNGDTVRGIIFSPLEYAPYVEYGTGLFAEKGGRKNVPWFYKDAEGKGHLTSGQHPQPYLRPALNENRERIIRILKEGIGK